MPYKDREKNLQYFRGWYRRNKKQQASYAKKYQAKHKNKIKNYIKKYREDRPWITSYCAAFQRCTNKNHHGYKYYGGRGIKFLMTLEDFKQLWFRDKADKLKWPSIDRINNNGHYQLDNCHFIEIGENSRKAHKGKKRKKR